MEIDCQFISIYGKFVTSQTASFSRADINVIPWESYIYIENSKVCDSIISVNRSYLNIVCDQSYIYGAVHINLKLIINDLFII